MSESDMPGPDYTPMGLVANPFDPKHQSPTDPYWMRLVPHAAANRLHVASLESRDGKPILVRMPDDVPSYYYVGAENSFLGRTGEDEVFDALAVNAGLDVMRLGRVRGTLTELAELISAVDFDLTLGAYCAAVFSAPDSAVPAFAAIEDMDLGALSRSFASEPGATVAEYFGEALYSRKADENRAEMVLREAYGRQEALERDPVEEHFSQEEAPGTTTSDASPPVTDDATAALPGDNELTGEIEESETEGERNRSFDVASYVIAHTKAHLSPVVARALRAYFNDGTGALAAELKVTKAPKKTLAALIKLALHRFRRLIVMYDRFDNWDLLEPDVMTQVLGSLQELRWVIGQNGGTMVAMVTAGKIPEIEEQFAGAIQVDWSMRGLIDLQEGRRGWDPELVQYWVDSASTETPSRLQVSSDAFAPLVEACGDDVVTFAWMARAAIEHAASRGLGALDAAAVEAGLGSGQPEEPSQT